MMQEKTPDTRASKVGHNLHRKTRTRKQLQQQVAQLAALNRFAQEVTRYLTIKDVVQSAHQQIQSIICPDFAVIFMRHGDRLICQDPGEKIHPVKIDMPVKHKMGQCLCGIVAETGQPIYSKDIQRDNRCCLPECKDAGLTSFAAFPLYAGIKTVGVLGIASKGKRDFSDQDQLFRTIAAHVGMSLHNAMLYEQVRQQTDVLGEMLLQHEQMERALEKEASFRKAIVERAAEGFCVCRKIEKAPFLHFSVWNDRMVEITGYTMDEINRTELACIVAKPASGKLPHAAVIERVLKGEDGRVDALEILRFDGQRRVVSISAAILNPDVPTPHILSIVQDNTVRSAAVNALMKAKKLEAAGVMAGGIAHDFNNLLTVILGSLSLIQEEAGWIHSVSPLLEQAEKSCLQAKSLTMKLITFATGGMPVKQIGKIKDALNDTVKIALAGTSFNEDVTIEEGLWEVEFDDGQFKHALSNVITNAVDASKEGGAIEVRAENTTIHSSEEAEGLFLQPGRYVLVSVQDFGKGIPDENVGRVFDPYFSTKEKGVQKGMGLGLTATYAVVKNHGGQVVVHSEEDMGTTVKMYFPAKERGEKKPIASGSPQRKEKKRILMMEDEKMLAALAGNMLTHLGYEAVTVANGTQAHECYKCAHDDGTPFDMVILDLTIKGGAGAEKTLQQLKEIDTDIRAIVSSGHANAPVMMDFYRYGFKATITKPYTLEQLKNVIEMVLREP